MSRTKTSTLWAIVKQSPLRGATRPLPEITCLLVALAITLSAAPLGADEKSERLETIRQEIEAREKRASEYASKAEGFLGELEAVDRELAEVRRSLKRLRRKERSADEEHKTARKQVKAAERALARTRKDLETRLVALYKFASTGGVASLYTAGDFQSFARSRQNLTRILEGDRQLFARHRARQVEYRNVQDEAARVLAEQQAARREVARREDRSRRKLVERKNLVSMLTTRSKREKRAAEELREAAKRLEDAIARMPSGAAPSSGSGLAKGRVSRPLAGAIRADFGRQTDLEFGTETLRNGIEIEADLGTPVEAVGAGRVLFAGWFRGYGQMVILDHGSSMLTVSGYLEELEVEAGEDVKTGQRIGTVGDTGSLSGPGLYFEIRQKGKPVDPRAWLQP